MYSVMCGCSLRTDQGETADAEGCSSPFEATTPWSSTPCNDGVCSSIGKYGIGKNAVFKFGQVTASV